VVNLCLDRRRRASPPSVPLEECRELAAPAEAPETRLQIDALLAQLSEELRVTLLLRVVAQMSYGEIARELRVPAGTVASRLNAAREQLRELWEQSEREAEGHGHEM
jgi:RNA polymerase sigma-70 factor (ECF subfamily)